MSREKTLHRRIRWLTWIFITGLIASGATAMPLRSEVDWITRLCETNLAGCKDGISAVGCWLMRIREALHLVEANYPFLFYGTDWLAFGHFVIATAFVGALRDPVRNRWLFDFGMIACVMVIPFALAFGAVRGIPFWWRLIDCSFGVFGFVPLWFCRQWAIALERNNI